VPQEPLDRVEVGPRLQEVRGKGMPQGMDTPALRDPGLALRGIVVLLRGGDIQRPLPVPRREQPGGRAILAPVSAELRQQPGRQEGVAILAALALLHPETPPLGVEVAELEPHALADPEPRRVGRGQERALLPGGGGLEETSHLGGAQDLGERLPALRPRDGEGQGGATQRRVVQEPERLHGDVTGAPGEVLLPEHVDQVRLALGRGEPIRRAMIVPRQAGHGREIGFARPLGHPPDEHVVVHAGTQRGHEAPPVLAWTGDRTPTTGVHRRRLCDRKPKRRKAERCGRGQTGREGTAGPITCATAGSLYRASGLVQRDYIRNPHNIPGLCLETRLSIARYGLGHASADGLDASPPVPGESRTALWSWDGSTGPWMFSVPDLDFMVSPRGWH
jgi:hypothetical protein